MTSSDMKGDVIVSLLACPLSCDHDDFRGVPAPKDIPEIQDGQAASFSTHYYKSLRILPPSMWYLLLVRVRAQSILCPFHPGGKSRRVGLRPGTVETRFGTIVEVDGAGVDDPVELDGRRQW